jgi:hypothetical protein
MTTMDFDNSSIHIIKKRKISAILPETAKSTNTIIMTTNVPIIQIDVRERAAANNRIEERERLGTAKKSITQKSACLLVILSEIIIRNSFIIERAQNHLGFISLIYGGAKEQSFHL